MLLNNGSIDVLFIFTDGMGEGLRSQKIVNLCGGHKRITFKGEVRVFVTKLSSFGKMI